MQHTSQQRAQKYVMELTKAAESQLHGQHFFVVLHNGQNIRETILKQVITQYGDHKTLKALKYIVAKAAITEDSTLLGTACSVQQGLFGLGKKRDHHSLIVINLHETKSSDALRLMLSRMISESLDITEFYENKYDQKDSNHFPVLNQGKPLTRSYSNLKADVFAALVMAFLGNRDALKALAKSRSEAVLKPKVKFSPEEYPFIIAMESLNFALSEMATLPPKNQIFIKARQLSSAVLHTFESSQIHQWWNFAKPAQDMAWRGINQQEIISYAVNTSDDPYVRATGMLIADILGLDPKGGSDALSKYNAFANNEHNHRAHKKAAEAVFEETIREAIRNKDGRPLYDAANQQNLNLTEGKVLGWCAHALQAAGDAYERARLEGIEATDIIRKEFSQNMGDDLWDGLKKFGESIVKKSRVKGSLSVEDTKEIAQSDNQFTRIFESILQTLRDPAYLAKLEAANDMAPKTPSSAPKMSRGWTKAAEPSGPAAPIPSTLQPFVAPSLGLGGNDAPVKRKPFPKKSSNAQLKETDAERD
jgi:hypothetical protein